jgi:hypothetical protein
MSAGVCDDRLLFTDCYAGEVGSIHDACMLRRSEVHEKMMCTNPPFPNNSHLIGDLAYPLNRHLLVAFKNTGRLSRREMLFNETLSGARSVIERAFALLKGRFRRLKYLDMSNIERIPQVIIACCVLHNICLVKNDLVEFELEIPDIDICDRNTIANDRREGLNKRNVIADDLYAPLARCN